MQNQQKQNNPFVWPFPSINGERTKESQELLDTKQHKTTKDDLSDVPDALF